MSADAHAELRFDLDGMRERLRVLAIAQEGLGHPENVRGYVEQGVRRWPQAIQEAADRLLAEFGPDVGARAVERFLGRLPVGAFVRLARPARVLPLR